MTQVPSFRVLALDGGGARAWISAHQLSAIEQILNDADGTDTPLGLRFDLIAGTSAGALLASGLAIGLRARELKDIFEKNVGKIFPKKKILSTDFLQKAILKLHGSTKPRYQHKPLQDTLNEVLQDKTFNDVKTHLCIASVRLDNGAPRLYKSVYRELFKQRSNERLADAVLASASAPGFFPATQSLQYSEYLVDGSICANNPSMIALVDALNVEIPSPSRPNTPLPQSLNDIALLSISTGELTYIQQDPKKLANAGPLTWGLNAMHLVDIFLTSQTQLTHNMVFRLLPEANYLRLSAEGMGRIPIDGVDDLNILRNATDIKQQDFEKIKRLFV